jgi:2-C-methyl-D-erythritol 4-phosphate cytidylyltransferase
MELTMATFSVLILTAAPPGMAVEAGGAYVKIDGREALLRSVELFLNRDNVKQITVVVLPEMLEEVKRKHGGHFGFSGVKLTSGGPKWMNQIHAGGKTISAGASHVIIHDAARPAVAFSDIDALMSEAENKPAVVLTSPAKSIMAELDEGGGALAYHLPSRFMNLLTPQAFARDRFLKMAETETEIHASELTLLKGSPLNVRISGPGDAGVVKAMINMLPKPKLKALSNPFEEAQW